MEDLIELTNWARMQFKPAKSRSLLLRRGVSRNGFGLKSERIGKWHRADLNCRQTVKKMLIQAETWLTSLEKSGLPGNTRPDCSGHSWFMRYLSPQSRGWRGS